MSRGPPPRHEPAIHKIVTETGVLGTGATESSPLLGETSSPDAQGTGGLGDLPSEVADDVNDGGVAERTGNPAMAAKMHLILPAVGIGLYLAAMDQTVTMASYAKMSSDLDALNSASWVTTSYFLTLTSFQPLYGKLSDIFGRKACLLFAHALFTAGCLGCGLALNLTQLCASRAISGIGAGGINSVVAILISDIVPLRDRGVWQGYINVIMVAGMATGAPLGGLLADTIGWRWSFIIQAPLCAAASLALHYMLKLPTPPREQLLEKFRRVDFLGAFVFVATITTFLVGLDSGSDLGWRHSTTVATLVATPILFAVFVLIEAKVATNPFTPGHIIFRPSLFPAYVAQFCNPASQLANFFLTPLYFQTVQALSTTTSGSLLVPCTLVGVLCTVVAGLSIKRTGKYFALTVATHVLLVCAVLLLSLGFWLKSLVGEVGGLMLSMAGGGSALSGLLVHQLAHSTPEDTAIVVACSYLFRSLGSSVGISISSAVMQQILRGQLALRLPNGEQAHEIEQKVRENIDYIAKLEPHVATEVRTSYQLGLLGATAPSLVFAVMALLVTLFLKEKRLSK